MPRRCVALVTGAAGFVGSHLAEALLARGHRVRGVDCFTPYYDPARKRANLATALADPRFELVEADLRTADLAPLLEGVTRVFHQAAQPGVRPSWANGFVQYAEHNVLATQRLLEAVTVLPVERFVYASSSSVYGNALAYPASEQDLPHPHSPYGVTKLAAEHLCGLYGANHDVPTVSLRYFTVYGSRQRPDMAVARFLAAALRDEPIPLYGTGEQVRDFTSVADVVAANLAAADTPVDPGTVLNVAGGSTVTVNGLLDVIAELVDRPLRIEHLPEQAGDVVVTAGSIQRARQLLGWAPQVDLRSGLAEQLAWCREELRCASST